MDIFLLSFWFVSEQFLLLRLSYLSFFPSFSPLILHCLFKLMHFIAFSDGYNSLTKTYSSLFLANASISLILMSPSLIC